jgi:hypothetical protein
MVRSAIDMNPSDAAAMDEFHARFRHLSEALRTELTFAGEAATIRRVLDHGSPMERGTLLIALGHCENVVVNLGIPNEEATGAADERAKRFLRGLIGDGEPLDKGTLRPVLEVASGEDVFVLNAKSGELKPFTAETAKTHFS